MKGVAKFVGVVLLGLASGVAMLLYGIITMLAVLASPFVAIFRGVTKALIRPHK